MKNYNMAVSQMFNEKERLIILGLTGRTGAGCSTAASILEKEFDNLDLEYIEKDNNILSDKYKFEIVKEYISKDDRWIPFTKIEGSCVILSFMFEQGDSKENGIDALIHYLIKLQRAERGIVFKINNFSSLVNELRGLGYILEEIHACPLGSIDATWNGISDEKIEEYYNLYINKMTEYRDRTKKILLRYSCYEEKKKKLQDEPPVKYHLYTYLLQKLGNNVRSSGNPYENDFRQDKILSFAKRLEKLINLVIKYDKIKKKMKTRICIDAIRNANESNYLKDIFRSYYLLSISVDEAIRRNRLNNLNIDEQNSLDNVEYTSKLSLEEFFYHQDIARCFEMADIHLVNEQEENGKKFFLTWQLVQYITLMIHPGLITPSAIERCMQLAYNAKYNSGCLSRQVGAVVTDAEYAVKSVGWNEVPKSQLSCSLRNIHDYCKGSMEECYSKFEHEDCDFQRILNSINDNLKNVDLHGRKFPYCFKDIYNGYRDEKNQVYTRSLHAEENAFLQISRYGGQGVKGGYLFCTASPCELCAKKAYQLGIENIYYIDPYPGISEKHILTFGKNTFNPKMNLYHGAIGEAYMQLFKPLLPYKDELELVSGISCKREAERIGRNIKDSPNTNDICYHLIDFSIEFMDRENIESRRKVDIEVKNGDFSEFSRQITWTGSSYDKSELMNNTEGYTLVDSKDKISPYRYKLVLNKTVSPQEHIKYHLKTSLKDEAHLMHAYFAQLIKHPTEHLILKVLIPENAPLIENVQYVRYADLSMECEYKDYEHQIQKKTQDGKIVYSLDIKNPNLFYTYSIEWAFINVKS